MELNIVMKSEGFVLVKKKIGVALATLALLAIAICSTGCGEKTDELSDLPQTPDAQQENGLSEATKTPTTKAAPNRHNHT